LWGCVKNAQYTGGRIIKKVLVIGLSLIAVVILFLTSFTNVIGYQTVQSSNQRVIQDEVNQRELLFQTIVDIANNKEIQRIILKSQMSRGIFPESELPVVTKNQLKMMYLIGLILSKFISKSRMQSMIQQYQLINPNIQAGINGVIEKDALLNAEINQLSNSDCDCENEINQEKISTTDFSDSPIICGFFLILIIMCFVTLAPLGYIEEIFRNMFTPLAVLFSLITFPIWFPIIFLILTPTVYVWGITFDCFPEVGPPN
jgi:hypothetical protein